MKKLIAVGLFLSIDSCVYAMEEQAGGSGSGTYAKSSESFDLQLQLDNLLTLQMIQWKERMELVPSTPLPQWGESSREFKSEMDKGADCMTEGLKEMFKSGADKEKRGRGKMKEGYEMREHAIRMRRKELLRRSGAISKRRRKPETSHVSLTTLSLVGH